MTKYRSTEAKQVQKSEGVSSQSNIIRRTAADIADKKSGVDQFYFCSLLSDRAYSYWRHQSMTVVNAMYPMVCVDHMPT